MLLHFKEKENAAYGVRHYVVVVKLSEVGSSVTYPLEGVPTSLKVEKSGRSVAIGLEEGRPVVFNIVDKGRR